MSIEGNAIHQQLSSKRLEDILLENAENFAGILEMYLPPREARRVGREIALRNVQQDIANGQVPAGQRRQSPPNLAQAQAAPAPQVQIPVDAAAYAEAKLRKEQAQRQLANDDAAWASANAINGARGRSADAVYEGDFGGQRNLQRYIPNPALVRIANEPLPAVPQAQIQPPAQAQNPGQLPSPEPMLGPSEAKEREEKHGDENARIAQAQAAPAGRPQAPANGGYPEPPNRLAPIPEEINRAGDLTNRGLGQHQDYLRRAEQQSASGAQEFPQRRQDYMNPYMQDVVDKIREEGLRTFKEGILPSLEAQFIRRGAHGGSRHAQLAQRAARDIQGEILARQTQARHTGYGQAANLFGNDQLRKLQHGQDIRNIATQQQGSNLADITSLMDMGRYRQSHEQHGKDNEYFNFMRKRNEPLELLERQSAALNRMPAPMSQFGAASLPENKQLNMPAQVGSAAAQLLGMSMRRVKEGGHIRRRRGGRTR